MIYPVVFIFSVNPAILSFHHNNIPRKLKYVNNYSFFNLTANFFSTPHYAQDLCFCIFYANSFKVIIIK